MLGAFALGMLLLPAGRSSAVAAQVSAAVPLSRELQKFADDCDSLRRGTIARLEQSLRGVRSGLVVTKDRAGTLQRMEFDLAELKARRRVVVPTLKFPPVVGEIGRLPGSGAHVQKIVSPTEAFVRASFRVQVVVTKNFQRVTEVVHRPVMFRLRGVPTANLSEGNDAQLDQVFRIAGSETVRGTDGSSSSILLLEPVNMAPIEAYLRSKPGL